MILLNELAYAVIYLVQPAFDTLSGSRFDYAAIIKAEFRIAVIYYSEADSRNAGIDS
ncbi:hypothetical protein SDC9_145306 [bioreactor metagenome]|uniref:Uncharacterized protein n=1 Tax=bioreactor metagenome TaxID=1076179 RepID=A0A645E9H4_9ZZZZ